MVVEKILKINGWGYNNGGVFKMKEIDVGIFGNYFRFFEGVVLE